MKRVFPVLLAALVLSVGIGCNDEARPPTTPAQVEPPAPPAPAATTPTPKPAARPWVDDTSPIALLPTDAVSGAPDGIVTIVVAGKRDASDLVTAPRFRTWLTAKYAGKVRLARIEDEARSSRLFATYGTMTWINGVRNFAVAYPDAAAVEADYAPILDAELAAAEAAIAKGTPPERIYVARSTRNSETAAYASHDAKHPVLDTTTVWRAPVGTSTAIGPADALVTAVLFCAPMTPDCRWFYDRVRAIVPWHAMRFVFRPYADKMTPCDREAIGLATVALPKGPAAYFTTLDALEALQPSIALATDGHRDEQAWNVAVRAGKAPLCDAATLRKVATGGGLRFESVAGVLADKKLDAELAANGVAASTVDGKKALFINGRRLAFSTHGEPAPNLSEAQLKQLVERVVIEEEERARARVASGDASASLYDNIVREGYVTPR